MISLDVKQSSSADVSPLSILPKDEKPTLSFASLLNAVGTLNTVQEDVDTKSIQKGILTLVLDDTEDTTLDISTKDSKKTDILSLLKNDKKISLKNDDEPLELNPKITTTMTPNELKTVIYQAKKYIKYQIVNSDAFKKHEIESLPKTLKGLVQVAKKIGIEISKITLEKVQEHSIENKTIKQEIKVKQKTSNAPSNLNDAVKIQTNVKQKVPNAVNSLNDVTKSKINVKQKVPNAVNTSNDVTKSKINVKQEVPNAVNTSNDVTKSKINVKQEVPNAVNSLNAVDISSVDNDIQAQKESQKQELTVKEVPKNLKETPLFKAQSKTKITTQELVNVKSIITEPKNLKEKTQNTLELLLRGEKASHSVNKNSPLTADFSVATAKVIAPSIETKVVESLESLLKSSETQSDDSKSKIDGLNLVKADSFEVKLHEAKQMMKYLSSDIKTAIEDYKSPFTRVKVQLNPQKLGEVDLTIVQRGKNLHINLSSNNAAINTLAMNASDLKVQLSNNGINNASLNFNNNAQTSDGSFGSQTQQQQQQQRDEAQSKYNYFAQEDNKEEILSSLEIVVPYYA